MRRLAQHLHDAADRQTGRHPILFSVVVLLFEHHEVVGRLRADGHWDAAHDRPIVALGDVVADTVGHMPPPFWTTKIRGAVFGASLGCCQTVANET